MPKTAKTTKTRRPKTNSKNRRAETGPTMTNDDIIQLLKSIATTLGQLGVIVNGHDDGQRFIHEDRNNILHQAYLSECRSKLQRAQRCLQSAVPHQSDNSHLRAVINGYINTLDPLVSLARVSRTYLALLDTWSRELEAETTLVNGANDRNGMKDVLLKAKNRFSAWLESNWTLPQHFHGHFDDMLKLQQEVAAHVEYSLLDVMISRHGQTLLDHINDYVISNIHYHRGQRTTPQLDAGGQPHSLQYSTFGSGVVNSDCPVAFDQLDLPFGGLGDDTCVNDLFVLGEFDNGSIVDE
jgi:hypothetical protein